MTDDPPNTSRFSRFGLSDVDPKSRLEKEIRESNEELIRTQKKVISEYRRANDMLFEMFKEVPKHIARKKTEKARHQSAVHRQEMQRLMKDLAREKAPELWLQYPRHNRDQIALKLIKQVPGLGKYRTATVSGWIKGLSPRKPQGTRGVGVAVSQTLQQDKPK